MVRLKKLGYSMARGYDAPVMHYAACRGRQYRGKVLKSGLSTVAHRCDGQQKSVETLAKARTWLDRGRCTYGPRTLSEKRACK